MSESSPTADTETVSQENGQIIPQDNNILPSDDGPAPRPRRKNGLLLMWVEDGDELVTDVLSNYEYGSVYFLHPVFVCYDDGVINPARLTY